MTRFLPTVAKFATATLALGLVAMPASADRTVTEEVSFRFNTAALSTPESAASVLAALKTQANAACSYTEPLLRAERIDDVCVDDVMRQAIVAIDDADLTEAYNIAEGRRIIDTSPASEAELAAVR
ncbi:MAG: UrcA family protein [Pseudomonadota bacterium]